MSAILEVDHVSKRFAIGRVLSRSYVDAVIHASFTIIDEAGHGKVQSRGRSLAQAAAEQSGSGMLVEGSGAEDPRHEVSRTAALPGAGGAIPCRARGLTIMWTALMFVKGQSVAAKNSRPTGGIAHAIVNSHPFSFSESYEDRDLYRGEIL